MIWTEIVRFLAIGDNIHSLSHVVDMCSYETPKGLLSLIQIGISHCRIDGDTPVGYGVPMPVAYSELGFVLRQNKAELTKQPMSD